MCVTILVSLLASLVYDVGAPKMTSMLKGCLWIWCVEVNKENDVARGICV